ncbi:MAG: hypothetical protein KQH79_00430 [Bacteroidetes bacterium]|nr:hypothetical protein [Bacteroidota bacterium]
MIVKRFTLIVLLSIFFIFRGKAQNENTCYIQDHGIHITDTSKLFLQIDNNNFVKNNEYFGQVAEGYTLLGFNLTPRVVYFPSTKVKLSAGGNFLTYYGRENEVKVSLLLSFQYKLHPKLDFILGNIYGTVNHKLIDPLFNFERFLNQNIENGIQFLWNSDRVFADLWLDWEQQILQDDPFQEKFNVGLSSNFLLINQESFKISVPFQNLIRHEGGQINSNSEEPLTTIFNNATGLSYSRPIHSKFLHHLDLTTYVVNYQDLSPEKRQMYIDGTASYTTLELTNNHIDLTLGYWYGEQFVAPIGTPIFESYSRTKFYVEEPIRQLAIGKISYQKNVFNGINLGFRFEGFYDLLGSNLEYTWAAMVVFNEKFFLKAF